MNSAVYWPLSGLSANWNEFLAKRLGGLSPPMGDSYRERCACATLLARFLTLKVLFSPWVRLVCTLCCLGMENFMAREIIRTANAPAPPPTYSQAVRAAGLVFVSGTGPHDPVSGKIVGETIQEQTGQCLKNVSAILEAAGSSLERVVSATVIVLEETDFAGMNEEWVKWFPANPPARQGAKLPVRIPGLRVSIAVIAEA